MARPEPFKPTRKGYPYHKSKLAALDSLPPEAAAKGTPLEQADRAGQLREQAYNIGDIATLFGCSTGHVENLLYLHAHTAERVRAAVAARQISATTAIELAKAVPEKGRQATLFVQAAALARKNGQRTVTARHFSVPLGKQRYRPHAEAVQALKTILDVPEGGSDINFTRRATVRAVLKFLNGSATADDLQRYLHGNAPPPA